MLASASVVFGVAIGILVLIFFLIVCLSEWQFRKQEAQKNALFMLKLERMMKETDEDRTVPKHSSR